MSVPNKKILKVQSRIERRNDSVANKRYDNDLSIYTTYQAGRNRGSLYWWQAERMLQIHQLIKNNMVDEAVKLAKLLPTQNLFIPFLKEVLANQINTSSNQISINQDGNISSEAIGVQGLIPGLPSIPGIPSIPNPIDLIPGFGGGGGGGIPGLDGGGAFDIVIPGLTDAFSGLTDIGGGLESGLSNIKFLGEELAGGFSELGEGIGAGLSSLKFIGTGLEKGLSGLKDIGGGIVDLGEDIGGGLEVVGGGIEKFGEAIFNLSKMLVKILKILLQLIEKSIPVAQIALFMAPAMGALVLVVYLNQSYEMANLDLSESQKNLLSRSSYLATIILTVFMYMKLNLIDLLPDSL